MEFRDRNWLVDHVGQMLKYCTKGQNLKGILKYDRERNMHYFDHYGRVNAGTVLIDEMPQADNLA